jgi:iron(III) transport system substrate-binding protein
LTFRTPRIYFSGQPEEMTRDGSRCVVRKNIIYRGVAIVAFAGAIACAGIGGVSATTPVTITLYSGQHPQTTASLVAAFTAKTGIRVAERDNDEDAMASQIIAEGSRSPADVVFTENSPVLEFLQERGRLAMIPATTLSAVPSKYNSPKGEWVGVSARVSLLVYNTKLLSPSALPKSVMDLANAQWKGKIGIAPTETDFQPIVTSVIKSHGSSAATTWLEALKRNAGSHEYVDNETLVAKVNSGAVALGVINQYYWYRLKAEIGASQMHSKLAYFSPHDPGYIVDISGAAVLSSSNHQTAAQKLVAFFVSKAGQTIIARSDSFEYPIGSGVTTAQPETPFSALQPAPLSIADLGDGQAAVALLQKAGLT